MEWRTCRLKSHLYQRSHEKRGLNLKVTTCVWRFKSADQQGWDLCFGCLGCFRYVCIYMMCIYIFLYVICLGQRIEASDIRRWFFFSHWLSEGHQSEKTLKAHYKHTHTHKTTMSYLHICTTLIYTYNSLIPTHIYICYIYMHMYVHIYRGIFIYACPSRVRPFKSIRVYFVRPPAGPAPRAFRKRGVVWGKRHPQESNPPPNPNRQFTIIVDIIIYHFSVFVFFTPTKNLFKPW